MSLTFTFGRKIQDKFDDTYFERIVNKTDCHIIRPKMSSYLRLTTLFFSASVPFTFPH